MHVLSIDQGTTGSTCLIISDDGRIKGRGYSEITQHYPKPGWVEHDAEEIVERTVLAARKAIEESGIVPDVIGITNQRETVVLWDKQTGKPVHRAIVWQDRRTAERCRELADKSDEIFRISGLVTDPYFSATKIEWLLKKPEIRRLADGGRLLAGTIDSFLIWRLTEGAVHATDHSNASRTMLYDIEERAWSTRLMDIFGVPIELLPQVRSSAGEFGEASQAVLGHSIPIRGVAGDQQAALFGQGGWSAGGGKSTYGTGAFLLLNTGDKRPEGGAGLLTTIGCDARGEPCYALEASIFIAGAAVQWLRDGLGIIASASETESIARSVSDTGGVVFLPALTGLGAPDWEPEARGMITGLTRGTTSAHLVRAALEAMAFGTADVMKLMRETGRVSFDLLRVDGGVTGNDWLMQFQADVLGVPVERPDIVETTALGAAGLAGIAGGIWSDANDFLSARSFTRFTPGEGRGMALEGHQSWRRTVRAALSWARDRN